MPRRSAITGGGTIDGNGESWWAEARATHNAGVVGAVQFRPRLVVFDHCKHIRMEGITVQNSPGWQIVPYYTDDMTIRNVRILAPQHSPNTDAIDPFSSSNMVIDHVYADVGDDNIAIKSGMINSPGPDAPSKNITITDCKFMHGHGLSIGSEIAGGAQNIHAERIHFKGTDQGIRIKANRDRGADVSNISFKDITMEDVKTSILISEYYPKAMPEGDVAAEPVQRLTPFFHNITIENVKSVDSPWAGVIVGLPESPVKDIVLKNVDIQATKGMQIAYAEVTASDLKVTATEGKKHHGCSEREADGEVASQQSLADLAGKSAAATSAALFPVMRSVFARLVAPATRAMRARGKTQRFGKKGDEASFAFPSTGGAVSAIFTRRRGCR